MRRREWRWLFGYHGRVMLLGGAPFVRPVPLRRPGTRGGGELAAELADESSRGHSDRQAQVVKPAACRSSICTARAVNEACARPPHPFNSLVRIAGELDWRCRRLQGVSCAGAGCSNMLYSVYPPSSPSISASASPRAHREGAGGLPARGEGLGISSHVLGAALTRKLPRITPALVPPSRSRSSARPSPASRPRGPHLGAARR